MLNKTTIPEQTPTRTDFAPRISKQNAKRIHRLFALGCVLILTACGGTTGPKISGPISSIPRSAQSSYPSPNGYNDQIASLPADEELPQLDVVQTTRIGVLLPMSGVAANAGLGLRNAAVLAQFQVNNPGLILQFYDTKGTAEGAQEAATLAINQGATLLIGPLFASSVQAVAPIAQSHSIPVLSFSTDPSVVSNNVYVTGFLIQPQIDRIISYAVEAGHQNFAILAPSTPYGSASTLAAQQAIMAQGANLVRTEMFDPKQINFTDVIQNLTSYKHRKGRLHSEIARLKGQKSAASRAALKRLKKLDSLGDVSFDALILPMGGSALFQVADLLKYYDVDTKHVKLLGTLLWQDEDLGKNKALRGAWYPAASRVGYDQFVQSYIQTYGYKPSQLTSLAYDMVTLAAALPQHSSSPWSLLTTPGGFIGVNGAFRLDYNGQVERMMAIREVQKNGSRLVSPAPTKFTAQETTTYDDYDEDD